MLAYKFDKETKEYLGTQEAQVNPLEGGYLLPAHCTFVEPMEGEEDKIQVFVNGAWILETDHRGGWQVKLSDITFSIVNYIGEANEGYQFITNEVYEQYQADNDRYKVINGVFTDIYGTAEYEEIKRQKEEAEFNRQFFHTTLGYVRRNVTMKDGTIKSFLTDILPMLVVGVPVLVYDRQLNQTRVQVTEVFINECKQQLFVDFYGEE